MAVIDSYSESNQDGNFEIWAATARYQVSQSFTGDGNVLGRVQLYLAKLGSPSGNITVYIYAHSGTFGTNSIPTGAPLATSSTINANTLSTSFALKDFLFTGANQITLTNGTKYCVVVDFTSGDGSNTVKVGFDSSSPTHAGNIAENDSRFGGWTARSYDMIFYVHTTGSSPSASLSPSASRSPSASESPSLSPSSSPSASMSPSPLPPHGVVLVVGKAGIDALRNSDPEKNMFDSRYGTLKYFMTGDLSFTIDGDLDGDLDTVGQASVTHNLGYYPYCEVYMLNPLGKWEYTPTNNGGAGTTWRSYIVITSTQLKVYAEISGFSQGGVPFTFKYFIYKNNLNL